MVAGRAAVAAEQLSAFLADAAELHVFVLFIDVLVLRSVDVAVGTGPFALGCLVELGVETAQVVGARAGVAKDDFAALLADLAVFLEIKIRV